ncbi:MAG: hypothetical protein MK100_02575 [Phycisphaerales bacterium]|nr:hypothetical protein [Phycisphaerales bacterium]
MMLMTSGSVLMMFFVAAPPATVTPADLAKRLNDHASVNVPGDQTCWSILSPALKAIGDVPDSDPPITVEDVWPGMSDWSELSSWAASHPEMGTAIEQAAQRPVFGLPYGRGGVTPEDFEAGLYIDLGGDDRLVPPTFRYLEALHEMAVWTAVEAFRLGEAGQGEKAIVLLLDQVMVLRRLADREFMGEKEVAIRAMTQGLNLIREVMFRYQSDLSSELLTKLAIHEIPALRPGSESLFLPTFDRRWCEALLENAFRHDLGTPHPTEFPAVFTQVQSEASPIHRFGIRRRWEMLQDGHDSLAYSQERLGLVFDDWWLRWRADPTDEMGSMILNRQSQFEMLNSGRFAAIDAVIHDMQTLFDARDRLLMEVNATATSAGILSYKIDRGHYPVELRLCFGTTMDKSWAADEHAMISGGYRPWLQYRRLDRPLAIDVGTTRVTVEPGTGLLYSTGLDGLDDRGVLHVDEKGRGDLLIWPPPRDLVRDQAPEGGGE